MLLKEAFRTVETEMLEGLRNAGYHDLRGRHVTVLRGLTVDGARTSDLAREAGITRQAVAQLVAELCALGYVEQVPDPRDRRAKIVRFTPAGLRGARIAVDLFQASESALAQRIGVRRLRDLKADLTTIINTEPNDH